MEISADENVRSVTSLVAHIYTNAGGKVVVRSDVITSTSTVLGDVTNTGR